MSINGFIDLNRFTKQTKIGQGSFGKVFKVKEKYTSDIFAAKISLTELNEGTSMTNLKREINIISQLNHPAILKFIGYSPIDFNNDNYPTIITEYSSNGSLADIIKQERQSLSPKIWDDTKKLINIYGIASAMSYLHNHNIIHRDLKPANILEDDSLFPKIADFGISKIIHQNLESITAQSTAGLKGTPIYCPPESWTKNEYTKAGDVYAFAIILYELLTLEEPFKDYNIQMIFSKVVFNGERLEFKSPIDDVYVDLITRCWSQNPDERPTFDEIVEELKNNKKFITDSIDEDEFLNYVDLVDSLGSSFNPNKKFMKITKESCKVIENDDDDDNNDNEDDEVQKNEANLTWVNELISIKGFEKLPNETQDFFKQSMNRCSSSSFKVIVIPDQETIMMYENGSMKMQELVNVLDYFESINFQVEYDYLSDKSLIEMLFQLKVCLSKISISIICSHCIPFFNSDSKIIDHLIISDNGTKKIGIAQYAHTCIKNVDIQAYVDTIGISSFSGCSSLESIIIPDSVKIIEPCAFSGCISLKNVRIPDSVLYIAYASFRDCKSLKIIIIPSSVGQIGHETFVNCTGLTDVIFKNTKKLTVIESSMFNGCSSLKQIEIPSSIKTIKMNAFCGCTSMTSVTFEKPSSLLVIESFAFYECSSLKKIDIPSTVVKFEVNSFGKCQLFEQMPLPSGLAKIPKEAFFEFKNLKQISIPFTVIKIESKSFFGCTSLEQILIPSSVSDIEDDAFNNCTSLKDVTFNDHSSLNKIGDTVFKSCTSITQISIPSSVEKIGKNIFENCTSLREISIPKTIKKTFIKSYLGLDKNVKIIKF